MSRDLEVIVHYRDGCCWDTASLAYKPDRGLITVIGW